MDAGIKEKWVEALRSGKYKQGIGMLRQTSRLVGGGDDEYCCLGVLCEIVADGRQFAYATLPDHDSHVYRYGDAESGLPTHLNQAADISLDVESILIRMNDRNRKSFDEIADYIETEL